MKKILSIIVVAFVMLAIFLGFKYYQDTYQSVEAYTVIPEKVPAKVQTTDDSGKVIVGSYSYKYTFKFVKKSGEKQTMRYELSGENVKPFKPGAYAKADISKNRITKGPNYVNKNDIPKKALEQLK
jgi:uncharacterized protein (TIGR01655 family)